MLLELQHTSATLHAHPRQPAPQTPKPQTTGRRPLCQPSRRPPPPAPPPPRPSAQVHYYTRVSNANATIDDLLSPLKLDEAVNDLKQIVEGIVNSNQAAPAWQSSRVRITEAGSVAGGGKAGVSNTFAAAIWTAETAFRFARNGAVGMNFHWGNAGLYQFPGAEPAYIGVSLKFKDNNPNKPYPVVRAPWYGYVLFSRATGNNGQAIALNLPGLQTQAGPFAPLCRDNVTAYSFLLPGTSEISLTMFNKASNLDCSVKVVINGKLADGTLTRLLPGRAGMASTSGITWGGATYEGSTNGRLRGNPRSENVRGVFEDPEVGNWTTSYVVTLPANSAALLLVPTEFGGATESKPAPLSDEEQEAADYKQQQLAKAGVYVPALPPVFGELGKFFRASFGSTVATEMSGNVQYQLGPDGNYYPVNTPLPSGPLTQGAPADGGAGRAQALAACPGVQKIATAERKGILFRDNLFAQQGQKRRRAV